MTYQWRAYLTERTKSPLMDVLSRTRNTPLSRSAFRTLLISSRDIIPINQLQFHQPSYDAIYSNTHTHTHNRLTTVCPGLPGYAGIRRNTHPLTPILITRHLYQLPPSTTIYSILLVQFACLTVFFHNLSQVIYSNLHTTMLKKCAQKLTASQLNTS